MWPVIHARKRQTRHLWTDRRLWKHYLPILGTRAVIISTAYFLHYLMKWFNDFLQFNALPWHSVLWALFNITWCSTVHRVHFLSRLLDQIIRFRLMCNKILNYAVLRWQEWFETKSLDMENRGILKAISIQITLGRMWIWERVFGLP